MIILALLMSMAVAIDTRSGKKLVLDAAAQAACITTQGYLSSDFTDDPEADCCSFIVCSAPHLNKTGFLGKCMGGTVWNTDLSVCDDPKYFPSCDPADCTVPVRTTALCGDLEDGTCCVGGREPVYTVLSDNSYSLSDGKPQFCPLGQVFSTSDCCCEFEYVVDPRCETELYIADPDNECCGFLQCFANKTGTVAIECRPPSVWNDVNKTCDLATNVMDCMNAYCGDEVTDLPCPPTLGEDQCCIAGIVYDVIDDITYRDSGSDRVNCCPVDDMSEVQLVFSKDDCCCEVPDEP
ncbi:unnamed protein product [Owenia fusiformis]|uniref:Uncharacterized protein n=1 Tax=Owenia fusiformis TaxID=6347 RepID=A0A8J1XPM7_OWEFU|nr:unnamed protein product [Owenia fusiformis]